MKYLLLLLLFLTSCCGRDYLYQCGEVLPAETYVPDPDNPHSQCIGFTNAGTCLARRTCANGAWVAIQTGPWYRCSCGE